MSINSGVKTLLSDYNLRITELAARSASLSVTTAASPSTGGTTTTPSAGGTTTTPAAGGTGTGPGANRRRRRLEAPGVSGGKNDLIKGLPDTSELSSRELETLRELEKDQTLLNMKEQRRNMFIDFRNYYREAINEKYKEFEIELIVYDEVEQFKNDWNNASFDYPFGPRKSILNDFVF